MRSLSRKYPQYSWGRNKGYGTKFQFSKEPLSFSSSERGQTFKARIGVDASDKEQPELSWFGASEIRLTFAEPSYYLFTLDASERMADTFDESPRFEAAKNALASAFPSFEGAKIGIRIFGPSIAPEQETRFNRGKITLAVCSYLHLENRGLKRVIDGLIVG